MLNLLPAGENPHLPNFETPPRRKQMTKLERRCQICQTGRKIKSSFSIRLAKSNDYDTNETMKQMNRPKSMRRMASNFENVIRFDLFRFAKSSESQLTEFRNIVNCAKMAEWRSSRPKWANLPTTRKGKRNRKWQNSGGKLTRISTKMEESSK